MTPLLFCAIALAGGLGCVARLVLDGVLRSRLVGVLPWATILINVSGSFLLGLVAALAGGAVLPPGVQLAVGTGFLGGYTTFSTASLETVRLLQERRWTAALLNGLGVLALATAAAVLGLGTGMLLSG
ncbi:fluoride efflux transporter CrcB [Brachybacterium hainanense]|uniref:Fluoride-specific ion channel FluC n=1 Tax=Brachybacterium hainanense TaxID=1541174 RepID=A0ABV6RBP8_9MICO